MRRLAALLLLVPLIAWAGFMNLAGNGRVAASEPGGGGGDLVEGESASISGSGFGTGPTLIAWDTFEGGTPSATITAPEAGASYVESQATYSTTSAHSGTKSAFSNPDSGDQFQHMGIDVRGAGDLYAHYWMRWTEDPNGGQLKQMQLWGDPLNETTYGPGFLWGDVGGFYATMLTEDNAAFEGGFQSFEEFNSTGSWNRIEMIGRQSSTGGSTDGQVVIRINGQEWYTKTSVKTRNSADNEWGFMYLMHGHTNPTGAYSDFYTDEVLVQEGWAGVYLGAQSSYSASDSANSLVPQRVTSWSSTDIAYTAFCGGTLTTGTVYEFVVNASRSVIETTERTITCD